MISVSADLARCDAEIAQHTALLLAGHEDMDGLLQAIGDWDAERRLILEGECG